MSILRPRTERGRVMLIGILLLGFGLAIGLPPVALWGPGAGLAVIGGLLLALAVHTPPDPDEPEVPS